MDQAESDSDTPLASYRTKKVPMSDTNEDIDFANTEEPLFVTFEQTGDNQDAGDESAETNDEWGFFQKATVESENEEDQMQDDVQDIESFQKQCTQQMQEEEHSDFNPNAEDTSDSDDAEKDRILKKVCRDYTKKQKAGKCTMADDINHERFLNEDKLRRARKARRRQVSEDDDEDSENSDSAVEMSIKKPPRKRQKKMESTSKPGSKKLSAQEKKQQRRENNLANLTSFSHKSIFDSANENNARAVQPALVGTNKAAALRGLMASIPEESRQDFRGDKIQLDKASKRFTGMGSCMPKDGEWLIKGMKSLLAHYQMLGVSFMRDRESENIPGDGKPIMSPPGGFHADTMGLGKTVMTIANIVNDRYKKSKRRQRPTLIVAPSSILLQWKQEFFNHAERAWIGEILLHDSRLDRDDNNISAYRKYGVVLASYAQVLRSYPKADPPVELVTPEEKESWWRKHFETNKGLLHSIKWRRIVLDEATAIKNHNSQTANACSELESDFRWCLSGTPIMNSTTEFYSYFRFLRVSAEALGSYRTFCKNFLDPVAGNERLIAFIRPFMLRRLHEDSILGAKLLDLPRPTRDTFLCHFSELHRTIYDVVHRRFIKKINTIAATHGEKGIRSSCSCILVMLLRLRQLSGHLLLIHDTLRDLLEDEDINQIQEIIDKFAADPKSNEHEEEIRHLRFMLKHRKVLPQLERSIPQDTSIVIDSASTTSPNLPGTRNPPEGNPSDPPSNSSTKQSGTTDQPPDSVEKFAKYLHDLRERQKDSAEIAKRLTCGYCGKEAKDSHVTSCHHTYCNGCLKKLSLETSASGQECMICRVCKAAFSGTLPYDINKLENVYCAAETESRKQSTIKAAGKIIGAWLDKNSNMIPSAKTNAFKAQILLWLEEDPTQKIIVYTQFVTMMKILSKICSYQGWKSLEYHGAQTKAARHNAITSFQHPDNPTRIMIMTLHTGGMGLNLTRASRTLMIDPWWNCAVEEQAFCRIYRRGQTKETNMLKLVVKGTVDERIIALQDEKMAKINAVIGDEATKKTLTTREIMGLFGDVGEDESGNPYIFAGQ